MVLECSRYTEEWAEMTNVVNGATKLYEWNKHRKVENHGMCYLLGLGNEKKRCVTLAVKELMQNAWT